MKLIKIRNLKFVGSNARQSLADISYPEAGQKLPMVIFAHGFKGFKDWGPFPLIAEELARNGFLVVQFNFSHNGGTETQPIDFPDLEAFSNNTYSKELDDIKHLIGWLRKLKILPAELVDFNRASILGHSRGGGIAILAAERYSFFKKVVSWAAVSDFESRLPEEEEIEQWKKNELRFIPNGRTKQEMPMRYDFVRDLKENADALSIERACKNLNIPQLIIHGEKDETVGKEAAAELKAWNPSAELEIVANAGHTFNGKHPWNEEGLPDATKVAIKKTIQFLKA